jgi:hypothetical protein
MFSWGYDIPMLLQHPLFEGVLGMEEPATYRAIVAKGEAKGRAEEARHMLLLIGEEYLGVAGAAVRAAVEAMADVDRLEQLSRKAPRAASWEELLNLPRPR